MEILLFLIFILCIVNSWKASKEYEELEKKLEELKNKLRHYIEEKDEFTL